MSEIRYTPSGEPTPGNVIRRQAETEADFTYSILGGVISIVDLNIGNRSVTNDVKSVLRKIEHVQQGSIVGFKIMYRDSEEIWDGQRASFFALRETEEGRARKRLLERK
jgi:hypothetical protein